MRMPFGKYKGWDLSRIPLDYLRWVWRECDLDPWQKRAVEDEFESTPRRRQRRRIANAVSGFASNGLRSSVAWHCWCIPTAADQPRRWRLSTRSMT